MKVLFAVVYNLFQEELQNVDLIEDIEDAVLKVVRSCIHYDISANNLALSFPSDITVTSPTIPVVCDITLLVKEEYFDDEKNRIMFAGEINEVIKKLLPNRQETGIILRYGGTVASNF